MTEHGSYLEQFDVLSAQGHAAKNQGNHDEALRIFDNAHALAATHGDKLKQIHAHTPAARAEWSRGNYNTANDRLQEALRLAGDLNRQDEVGITFSNIGRLAAVKTVQTLSDSHQVPALRGEAVPHFRTAYQTLRHHPHFYYRYANAQHGSVVAALAGDRRLAAQLITDGLRVAFRTSKPYDRQPTYQINKAGLGQLAVAGLLIPFGNRTPLLAKKVRQKFVR